MAQSSSTNSSGGNTESDTQDVEPDNNTGAATNIDLVDDKLYLGSTLISIFYGHSARFYKCARIIIIRIPVVHTAPMEHT